MPNEIKIGKHKVGNGNPAYIVAEIGINHNGDLDTAKDMILSAKETGANAVKFQKRTPELCVPKEQQNIMRETPWGYITYMEYRERVEFGEEDYREIDRYCKEIGIDWFVSVWDESSVDFIEKFDPLCYKLPSASLTDLKLLAQGAICVELLADTVIPNFLSEQIFHLLIQWLRTIFLKSGHTLNLFW